MHMFYEKSGEGGTAHRLDSIKIGSPSDLDRWLNCLFNAYSFKFMGFLVPNIKTSTHERNQKLPLIV